MAASSSKQYVIKRDGSKAPLWLDKITRHTEHLRNGGMTAFAPIPSRPSWAEPLPKLEGIDSAALTRELAQTIEPGTKTSEIGLSTAELCRTLSARGPEYSQLAARLEVCEAHWATARAFGKDGSPFFPTFADMARKIATRGHPDKSHDQRLDPLLVEALQCKWVADTVNANVDYGRDYAFGALGWGTVSRSLLGEKKAGLRERPQDMYMRVALGVRLLPWLQELEAYGMDPKRHVSRTVAELMEDEFHERTLEVVGECIEVYKALSLFEISHASPTQYSAGTTAPQLSSCFKISAADNMKAILYVSYESGFISQVAGGVSMNLGPMRASGSRIRSTDGVASGVPRFMPVLEKVQDYVDQGGRRKGAFAAYLPVWHADLQTFLMMGLLKGTPLATSRSNTPSIKLGLAVYDYFMECVEKDRKWYLFCPDDVPELATTHGARWHKAYVDAVVDRKWRAELKAREVYAQLTRARAETGHPYVVNVDTMNAKSNLRHLGTTIRTSNLCVSGETLVLCKWPGTEVVGHFPIERLAGQVVPVWNGREWSPSPVAQTSLGADLLEIATDSGDILLCTPEHKFYGKGGEEIRAKNLKPGQPLEKCPAFPDAKEGKPFPLAYTHGFFCADGHYSNGKPPSRCTSRAAEGGTCRRHTGNVLVFGSEGDPICRARTGKSVVNLYGPQKALRDSPKLRVHSKTTGDYASEDQDRLVVNLPDDLPPKFDMGAVWVSDMESRLRWLEGYLDGDGCVLTTKTDSKKTGDAVSLAIQVVSAERGFLAHVRLLLQTLGCNPKIKDARPAGTSGIKGVDVPVRQTWRLLISTVDLWHLVELGFSPERLDISALERPNRSAGRFTKVLSVAKAAAPRPTFCLNEPKRHRAVFNGLMTGQCVEITLPAFHKSEAFADHMAEMLGEEEAGGEIGVCNLAALCMGSYVRRAPAGTPAPPEEFEALNTRGVSGTAFPQEPGPALEAYVPVDSEGTPVDLPTEEEYAAARYDIRGPQPNSATMREPHRLSRALAARVGRAIDWKKLIRNAGLCAENLDNIIDLNLDPTMSGDGRRSNLRHRPIGIGQLGLADLFFELRLVWGEPAALLIDRALTAARYYGAASKSVELARRAGKGAFPTTHLGHGAPSSFGKLTPDLWAERPARGGNDPEERELGHGWEEEIEVVTGGAITPKMWAALREQAIEVGLRNCYLLADMPTASTSNVVGQSEAFYPVTSNVFSRRVLSGNYTLVNPHLKRELRRLGVWDERMVMDLLENEGSVQGMDRVPPFLQRLFQTARELDPRVPIVHAGRHGRGPWICQSQSMNHFRERATMADLWTIDRTGWQEGLKSLSYYVYTQPRSGGRKIALGAKAGGDRRETENSATESRVAAERPAAVETTASGGAGGDGKAAKSRLDAALEGSSAAPIRFDFGGGTFGMKCDPSDKDCAACAL
jgi:ribonucleotide reductase alpha subunit